MKLEKKDEEKKRINPLKIKTIILSIVIAIVLTAFVIYLIQTFYPAPEYSQYCDMTAKPMYVGENITKEICESNDGTWIPQELNCIKDKCTRGYCDYYTKCDKEFRNAENQYKLVAFVVAIILGLIAIILGVILSLPSVSFGLMLGGAILMFYGTAIYWTNLLNIYKALILGIVLIILIWLGYKKLKN